MIQQDPNYLRQQEARSTQAEVGRSLAALTESLTRFERVLRSKTRKAARTKNKAARKARKRSR